MHHHFLSCLVPSSHAKPHNELVRLASSFNCRATNSNLVSVYVVLISCATASYWCSCCFCHLFIQIAPLSFATGLAFLASSLVAMPPFLIGPAHLLFPQPPPLVATCRAITFQFRRHVCQLQMPPAPHVLPVCWLICQPTTSSIDHCYVNCLAAMV